MKLINADSIIETYKTCADMLNDDELKGAELVIEWIEDAPTVCDIEQIREEILNTFLWENETEENLNYSVRKCLEIIDRYTKGEEDEHTQR